MNTKSLIAAAMFVVAGTAFAADAPETVAAASAATATASKLNLPALGAPSDTPREETKAEAVDVVKNYKTALALQLEQYKN
ncbi:hypothetical protein [Massilia niabensis]|uniref:DUF4148 domain-containing protein n=1 Tax=Massilia niabensis TaxID=544910 RepID=A0ABW0L2Y8_9BURK